MDTFDFTLIVEGIDLSTDEDLDRLYEVGLDDATPSIVSGVQYLDVTREADSYGMALFSAIGDVQRADGIVRHVLEADPSGGTRPGLVSLSDIARRTGWTREYVRLLALGKRGPGGFPPPHRTKSPVLYAWSDVLEWIGRHRSSADISERLADLDNELRLASVTRYVNAMLDMKELGLALRGMLSHEELKRLRDQAREAIDA